MLDALRRHIGVVLQDVFLFSGSVKDNITLRNDGISQAQVEDAAKMIDMHEFISSCRGVMILMLWNEEPVFRSVNVSSFPSSGRFSYNPSILILDEATSSVDTESELLIQHAIDKLIKGRTSIVIAHRLSTIRKASKIIVLDKGEIKEIGTHEELIKLGGFYANLHKMQFEKKPVQVAG